MAEPLPICYLNGTWVPWEQARISPFDRGFLYSDGVYEVMPVYDGRPFRFEAHSGRLIQSLAGLQMKDPHTPAEWREIIGQLITRNGGGNQYVYWQVTRGAERGRNHAPLPDIPRTVFAFCAPFPALSAAILDRGLSCITAPDNRWARCDIKSISLLANVLLRELAAEAGAAEAILLKDGELTEASSSGVHIVINGEVLTPPRTAAILPGTTRSVMEELTQRAGIARRTVRVTEVELRTAEEIWLTSSTREVAPVSMLDGKPVGTGKPGPIWQVIHAEFQRYKQELSTQPW